MNARGRQMTCRTATICILLLLSACSPDAPAKPFGEQRNALDKARAVDAAQQQQAQALRKAIDQQTQ
jgi:hypothetical protein